MSTLHRAAYCLVACATVWACTPTASAVTLARNGVPRVSIVVGGTPESAAELRRYLSEISGADFAMTQPKAGAVGLHVGLARDFPWVRFDKPDTLGPEGFIIKTAGDSVYLVGAEPLGAQHAVTTFLQRLGCRWFFPGDVWAVVPRRPTIEGEWNERQTPSFTTQRRIWYGYGGYARAKRELADWDRHNRMGGPVHVRIGHTWNGLNPDKDFAAHPDWFALVDGKRQPTKPCYSHPMVLQRAITSAKKQAARGGMVSVTPPDGLGYCECERCRAVFKGGEPKREHGTLFARRPDGTLVNITSETLFAFVNKVAEAVTKDHPAALIGCYAYSAYSHPPSFDLHPSVYLQTTTAYRRTPITLAEQLTAYGKKTRQLGIREYYSVFQWDWDYPTPGRVSPARLQEDLKFFRGHGVTAVNAEASNNWGPRGLGYYVAAQLMWDVDADVLSIVRDFYEQAFGPAAHAMQRYYVRWYGPSAAVLESSRQPPTQQKLVEKGRFNVAALRDAFNDLDEAARLTRNQPDLAARVDQLRMYLHYLVLRYRLHQARLSGANDEIRTAIAAETVFGGRLADTNLVHTRALIGKAFPRRFRAFADQLEGVAEAERNGHGWRRLGEPPTQEELNRLWEEDRALLGVD